MQPEMYGTPYGEYELNGVISDKETSLPLQNIQVVIPQYGDTLYTDSDGKYVLHSGSHEFYLKIEDVDADENGGHFESKEMKIIFTKEDQVKKGDGEWYEGSFVKTENIKLEKK
jgi:putative lipoprotein (rSAM/lipoprotein system)